MVDEKRVVGAFGCASGWVVLIPQVCPAAAVVAFGCMSIFSISAAGVGMVTTLVPATIVFGEGYNSGGELCHHGL